MSLAEEQTLLCVVMPLLLSDELRRKTIKWTEIQALYFPDRTAAWSKSPLRVQSLGGGGGGGVCSRSSTARWFGHPPLQTIAQGHHTLGELREESPRRHSTWMPKRGSCGSALSCRPPESLISPPFVPSRLPHLGQESLDHLQAQEGARRSEAQPSRLGGAVTQQMNMQMQI